MNIYLLSAAALLLLVALFHSVLGEMKIFMKMKDSQELPLLQGFPLLRKNPDATKLTLRMVWHIPTVLAFCLIGIIVRIAFLPSLNETEVSIIWIIGASVFVSFLVSLIMTKGIHGSWIAFLLTSILLMLGVA
jgi:hypothetical protein